VGTSSKLSFAKPSVWTLSDALVDDEIELINEDDLLDESDLIKPAAESLRGNLNTLTVGFSFLKHSLSF
jgi:hypothetical protein